MFGEVGLAGEIRGITQAALRVREASQMGFRRCIVPEANSSPPLRAEGRVENDGVENGRREDNECELVGVTTIGEALDVVLGS
jgi:DNA repair protein RadA/Sms